MLDILIDDIDDNEESNEKLNKKSLPLKEQEMFINAMRDEETATLYASDNTWITKMDKLVQKNPELFKIIEENEWGKCYEFPKRLITIKSCIRTYSEEQKTIMANRLKEARNKKENKR